MVHWGDKLTAGCRGVLLVDVKGGCVCDALAVQS